MSKFLGPIHFWLFNKIKIQEGLELEIESSFKEKFGDDVTSIVKGAIDKYGDRIGNAELDDIVDEGNIHGWLQSNISVVETRQAAILAGLFCEYDGDAVTLAKDLFRKNGTENGTNARDSISVSAPEDVYKSINNYALDGMPCDTAANVVESTDDKLVAKQGNCLHINYWTNAGLDADTMYELRTIWTKSFVTALDDQYEYDMVREGTDGNSFTYTITRK